MRGACAGHRRAASCIASSSNGGCSSSSSSSVAPSQADPVQRARKSMGYRNNWHRKPVDTSKQVAWSAPMEKKPVAIIGGGIAGLSCAAGLAALGLPATVFDTGEHGVGGRAATRDASDGSLRAEWLAPNLLAEDGAPSQGLVFDHAAQAFTATDPAFAAQTRAWEAAGVVRRWDGPVGMLHPGGHWKPLPDNAPPLWVPTRGMRALAEHMAHEAITAGGGQVQLVRPMWVSRMTASSTSGGWALSGKGGGLGTFGAVVIAHNGKCANRLVGSTGAPLVAQQLMRLRLSAVWAVMVAFKGSVQPPGGLEGAFVRGSTVLSWAANNSAKLQQSEHADPHGLQCWTLISTNSYGQANKVPQEKVPPAVADKVAADMLSAFAEVLGLPGPTALPPVAFSRCQLWGAALPLNSPGVPCILDAAARVGVCGDWLTGAGVQAAWLSGAALAARLAAMRGAGSGDASHQLSVGLESQFEALREAEIGEFPGLPKDMLAAAAAAGPGRRSTSSSSSKNNTYNDAASARSQLQPVSRAAPQKLAAMPARVEKHSSRQTALSRPASQQLVSPTVDSRSLRRES